MSNQVPPPPPLPADGPAPEEVRRTPQSATCPSCAANLVYAPGTTKLRCEACGTEVDIELTDAEVEEHSLTSWSAQNRDTLVSNVAAYDYKCQSCGAETTTSDLSGHCQFCGGVLVASQVPEGLIEPEGVVPFAIEGKVARENFRAWVSSRWFAPNALKKVGDTEDLKGTYLPHWTFDAHTETDWQGERGDHHQVTRTRTVPDGNGGTRTEQYQETETRWTPVSGHVAEDFDDVLVSASTALDGEQLDKLDFPEVVRSAGVEPFQPEYLTGYSAVRYEVDPPAANVQAKELMVDAITSTVRSRIGGDEQRVERVDVSYSSETFKLILLPLWIATYLYAGRTWNVMVNASNGTVIGERPYSRVKIALAVLGALVAIAVVVGVILAARGR